MVGLPIVALLPNGVQVSLASLWSRESTQEDQGFRPQEQARDTASGNHVPRTMAPLHQPAVDSLVAPALYKPPTNDPSPDNERALVSGRSQQMEEELHNLGATYYRMESWGAGPRKYRFHCTVAIRIGLAEYSQRFEETAEDPLAALEQVLEEVRTWHARFDPERLETQRSISDMR